MDMPAKYPKSERHDSLEMIGLKDDLLGNDVMLWNSTSYNRTKLDNVIFKWHEKNILMPCWEQMPVHIDG